MTATLIVVYRFSARVCVLFSNFLLFRFFCFPRLLRSGQLTNKALIDVLIAAVAICRSVTSVILMIDVEICFIPYNRAMFSFLMSNFLFVSLGIHTERVN